MLTALTDEDEPIDYEFSELGHAYTDTMSARSASSGLLLVGTTGHVRSWAR